MKNALFTNRMDKLGWRLFLVLFTNFLFLSSFVYYKSSKPNVASRLSKLTYSFTPSGDGKDWNTTVRVYIYYDGRTVAEQPGCCSSDRNRDGWGSSGAMDLPIKEVISPSQLKASTYRIGIIAQGNDSWNFDAQLRADYDDGTSQYWSLDHQNLTSTHGNYAIRDYSLANPR